MKKHKLVVNTPYLLNIPFFKTLREILIKARDHFHFDTKDKSKLFLLL